MIPPATTSQPATPLRRHRNAGGFSLIEMIGVLALMAIAAGVLTPSLAQRISRAKAAQESATLADIAEALRQHIAVHQEIPGAGSWSTQAAQLLGRSASEVLRSNPNDPATTRVYLIHPAFQPATTAGGTFSDPLWSQGVAGTPAVQEARILLLAVHRSGLTLPFQSGAAPSAAAFDAVWDWYLDPATDAPPAGWPAEWQGNGEYLHVQRLNLRPLFRKVTFSNTQFPDQTPSLQIGSSAITPLDATPAFDALFLEGSSIRAFRANDGSASAGALQFHHVLQRDVNLVYADDQWWIP